MVGAASVLDQLDASYLACLRSKTAKALQGADVGGGQESFPTVGDRTVAYRLQATIAGSQVTIDALFATKGPTLIGLLVNSGSGAPDAGMERSLLTLLVGRA